MLKKYLPAIVFIVMFLICPMLGYLTWGTDATMPGIAVGLVLGIATGWCVANPDEAWGEGEEE